MMCHAPRERVSWNYFNQDIRRERVGHAPRERVSWNCQMTYLKHELLSHAPRERVSWNAKTSLKRSWPIKVTLHVSVWVEIRLGAPQVCGAGSRSTWACELKFWPSFVCDQHIRHAPRERVSWNLSKQPFKCLQSVTLHVSVWVEMSVIVQTL